MANFVLLAALAALIVLGLISVLKALLGAWCGSEQR